MDALRTVDSDDEPEECRKVIAQLYEFLDSELTDDRRERVREHLDHCGSCLEAFEFEAELRAVIVSHSKEQVPESLMHKLALLIEEEDRLAPNGSSE
ncbi:mycothiol system anti-sigma-R factor [Ferrimicrobium sp.]|uniref:mycothiol system anti-sigma-R factor n=1 Tax=Ferrimicrobium sp. TaxID=2926050 RepID=UPI00260C70A3|nr:mycothiol system anti-sigma-R factor [Ferrimicrobium sp.]